MTLNITRLSGNEALGQLARRGHQTMATVPDSVNTRTREIFGTDMTAEAAVERILNDVRNEGDDAIARYNRIIDRRDTTVFEVTRQDIQSGYDRLDAELRDALELAASRIRDFHQKHARRSWMDTSAYGIFGQIIRPLDRVGIYAPGGTAALPSSLLMLAIPARVAGVEDVIVCTPPHGESGISDVMLAAAHIAEVDRVFAIGGAQAIAAMAFGTETVPQVDKICGPGNIFVALAKQRVAGVVAIDQIAGPTETLVVADDSASLELVAADLIAQAEHDVMASAILVTTSKRIAEQIEPELERQIASLPRADIIRQSLADNGVIAQFTSIEACIDAANAYAPEHMCLSVSDPWSLVPMIRNAGGIFIGEMSPEALGDYAAGPSHVMPTGGSARYSSPTHVGDFEKVISLAAANRDAINALGDATMAIARAEGLEGHATSIQRRLDRH